jgi:hypothetical protein
MPNNLPHSIAFKNKRLQNFLESVLVILLMILNLGPDHCSVSNDNSAKGPQVSREAIYCFLRKGLNPRHDDVLFVRSKVHRNLFVTKREQQDKDLVRKLTTRRGILLSNYNIVLTPATDRRWYRYRRYRMTQHHRRWCCPNTYFSILRSLFPPPLFHGHIHIFGPNGART